MDNLTPKLNWVLHTFGCKVNTYDSSVLEKRLTNGGESISGGQRQDIHEVVQDTSVRQVHLINSCAVTQEATREALRVARRIKRSDPKSLVVMTGCSAQVDGESVDAEKLVDLVVANSHKGELEKIVQRHLRSEDQARVFRSNIFKKEDLEFGGGEERQHSRAFLKIQDGCNSFCTYCVIPFARGKSRSLSIDSLVQRVRELEEKGFREVVLTGVHIGDYDDNGLNLCDLIEGLLLRTTMPRFRLSSLEPVELSGRLLDFYQDPRMCRHFHMSIQSNSNKVLKLMKRNYSQADVESSLQMIEHRVPNAFVGMDVIAGFPGEDEAEFLETYSRLSDLPWTRLHVFPYSERPGTFALKLSESVDVRTRGLRAQRLRELSKMRYESRAYRQIGSQKMGLRLGKSGVDKYLSRDFWTIIDAKSRLSSASTESFEGRFQITGIQGESLIGEALEN